jgi:protein tyrosine phosphatase (PTP) superfamily phosphohydrolase (DUF442 family)
MAVFTTKLKMSLAVRPLMRSAIVISCLLAAVFAVSTAVAQTTVTAPELKKCVTNLNSPVPNFCEVDAGKLWRGARPAVEDVTWLLQAGVKSVVNLELLYDDLPVLTDAHDLATKKITLNYYRVRDWEPLVMLSPASTDEHVVRFLAIASQAEKPLYVHCRSGENRTGVMVAAYKLILQGEKNIDAVIDEMKNFKGFWSSADAKYLRTVAARRDEFVQRVKAAVAARDLNTKLACAPGACSVPAATN